MRDEEVDYYAVLGINAQASAAEVTRAYRRLVRRLHPDTRDHHGEPDGDADARLALVRTAFDLLHDPAQRAAYDRRRRRATPVRRPSPATCSREAPPIRAGPVRYWPS